ncbi:hypothetical protein WA026_000042 [Henosepilachna vigintioctopunctata]|uniref:SLC26A/SulP transporter domain-containing protein n=1 Tax=Henosepilachna vigintioctopunctata TaxID=420089 RepID=A0AAW1UY11_9CUCU
MVPSVFSGDARTNMEDIQGEGGGGFSKSNGYDNPAFRASSHNVSHRNVRKGFDDFEEIPEHVPHTAIQSIHDLLDSSKIKIKKFCTRKTLYKRLPILTWLPQYSTQDAIGDLVAGITVGLTVIPQSLAYASIAHLPLQYGLYTSFLGCLIYIFLGTCKDVPFGPTAIASIMTYEVTVGRGPENAIILCFITGFIQFLMGVFGFGFIIDFVSGPVASGFTSAVALIILTSQVKNLLGIPTTGTVFTHQWSSIVDNLHHTNHWDAILGLICIIFLLLLRIGSRIPISTKDDQGNHRGKFRIWRNRIFWFIATSRSALLVIVCGFIGYEFFQRGEEPSV